MTDHDGLTTEERRAIRQGLIDMDFQRGAPLNWDASTHPDKGDGSYAEEWWGPGRTHVVLTWRPKSLAASEADRATAGEREASGFRSARPADCVCPPLARHLPGCPPAANPATPPADDASEVVTALREDLHAAFQHRMWTEHQEEGK